MACRGVTAGKRGLTPDADELDLHLSRDRVAVGFERLEVRLMAPRITARAFSPV